MHVFLVVIKDEHPLELSLANKSPMFFEYPSKEERIFLYSYWIKELYASSRFYVYRSLGKFDAKEFRRWLDMTKIKYM